MLSNIKSKLILKKIFKKLKNKTKLNIIKHNNKLIHALNITKDDFEPYISLKEFNKKFRIKISDINTTEINLNKMKI